MIFKKHNGIDKTKLYMNVFFSLRFNYMSSHCIT